MDLGNLGRKEIYLYTLCFAGLWNFCFFISAWVVSGSCYYEPCMEGDGWGDVFEIDTSESFVAVATALAMMAHTGYGIYLHQKRGTADEFAVYTGMSMANLVLVFQTIVSWGGRDALEKEFTIHGDNTESGRLMKPNSGLEHTFGALTAFAVLSFACKVGTLYMCTAWKEDLSYGHGHSDISGGASSSGSYSTGFIGAGTTGPQTEEADRGTYSDL